MILVWSAAISLACAVFCVMFPLLTFQAPKNESSDLLLQQNSSGWANSVAKRFDGFISGTRRNKTATKLSIAGLRLRPAEWMIILFATMAIIGAIGLLISGFIVGVIGAISGLLLTRIWLSFKISHKHKIFEEDLADSLQLMAGSLRSGLSLNAALASLSANGRDPIASEMKRVISHNRLGVSTEDGLEEVAERMKNQDFEWVALAVRIQKEVGGNLADILTTTAATIRERTYLRRQIKTLSAESRLSSYILMALPILMTGWLLLTRKDYLAPLWTTSPGIIMSVVMSMLMVIGWFWMRAVIKVES